MRQLLCKLGLHKWLRTDEVRICLRCGDWHYNSCLREVIRLSEYITWAWHSYAVKEIK